MRRDRRDMRKPNLFIVGAPESGTTALHEYLKEHPDIFMSDYKEPHYFGSDLSGPRMMQFRGREYRYLMLFARATDERWVGESSIWSLYSSRAAREIHAYDSRAAIIIMLRSPVEVSYSLFYQARYTGNEVLTSFEQALDMEAERRAGRSMPPRSHTHHGLYYTTVCQYYEQVKRYFDIFGRDAVHVIIYDDFRADTAAEYRRTLEYLDVDPAFTTDFRLVNTSKQVQMPTAQKVMLRLGISPMLVKDRLTYIGATTPYLPTRLRRRLLNPAPRAYARPERRPPLAPETAARLRSVFLPDVERLSELLGRDLTHWCGDQRG
jgi:hypothetical protein